MLATLDIKESATDIQRKISLSIVREMSSVFVLAKQEIAGKIKLLIRDRIDKSDVFQSIMGGDLQGELGIRSPDDVLLPILNKWVESLTVSPISFRSVGGVPTGGFTISFIEADWHDVLEMPQAEYISRNRRYGTAIKITWLQWLLEAGSQVLVRNWEVSFHEADVVRGQSRSGIAVMVESRGGYWQVPAEYRGTTDDNFVLRALEGIEVEINEVIKDAVLRRLAA